ncbi:unnamed protein product, partial [marine sediment metagenome]
AKAMGDKLVVGVLTDEAVMEKKPRRAMSFSERMILVGSLECVDLVIPQKTYAPHDNVEMIGPDILMESIDHSKELLEKSKSLMSKLKGRVIITPYYPEQSSTKIKEKIKNGDKA